MLESRSERERFPELFAQDKRIDRHKCKREVPMKVLVYGMMRTGTASMRAALKQLGYVDTHHMMSVFENPLESQFWVEAYDAKYFGKGKPFGREKWDQLLGHCQAVCDLPSAAFVPELVAAYPNAKVILTPRSPDSWHKSCMDTIVSPRLNSSRLTTLLRSLDPSPPLDPRLMQRMFDGVFGGRDRFITHGKQTYQKMLDEVRDLVPQERLLEYQMGEGWGRLCEFLGEDVPDTCFPRVNETGDFHERIKVMKRLAMGRIAKRVGWWVGVVVAPVVVGVAWWAYGGEL